MPTAIKDITSFGTYRRSVAIALFNTRGQVFMGSRLDTQEAWQMPQGGIEPGEDILTAALRELEEEVGLPPNTIEILEVLPQILRYDLPEEVRAHLWSGLYKGQAQTWVAARLIGGEEQINLTLHQKPEFGAWRWIDLHKAPNMTISFKREIYQIVAKAFSHYAKDQ